MTYRIFSINVLIRLVVILLLGYAIVFVLTQTHFWLVSFWLALLSLFLFAEMLRYIRKSHKEMENLLVAIRQGDFSTTYQQRSFYSGNMLSQAFTELVATLQHLRREKETQHLYLQNIVEQVNIGLLCFDGQGRMQLVNKAAQQLFQKPYLKNLQDLAALDAELYSSLKNVAAGEKRLVKVLLNQELLHLSMQATAFKMHGEDYKLIALQDLRHELEQNEMDSWQKLIRVLTHEIMNSVIPIANLSAMVNQTLIHEQQGQLSLHDIAAEDLPDLQGSLKTIEARSQGLVSFVKAYRSLTQIAQPRFSTVEVRLLFDRVHTLFKPRLSEVNVTFSMQVSPADLSIKADFELVEQVLINLMHNAVEALNAQPNGSITLKAYRQDNQEVVIQVADNGPGIEADVAEQIFIPFFTTKPEGSGIGLSLSRQIMRLHRGTIAMHTQPGTGTVLTLRF